MGAGQNFLNWLQGTFGGNNGPGIPDLPLPMGDKAPTAKPKKDKPAVKKAAPKKVAPKKKEQ